MIDERWGRVAKFMRERREDLRMTQRDVSEIAKVDVRLISSIERAERDTYKPRTLRAVSLALGWSADSINRIAAGDDPIVLDAPMEDAPPDLRAEVDHLRREIELLRAAVETLTKQR